MKLSHHNAYLFLCTTGFNLKMPSCVVKNCKNHSRKTVGSDIKYFSFPKEERLCKQWIDVCQSQNLNLENGNEQLLS